MSTLENMSRIVVTAENHQDFYFMQEQWLLMEVDGEHNIHVGTMDGERADECQHHVTWDHGLYADDDAPRGQAYSQWDEAHVMALIMRAAPDMLKVLFKIQQHVQQNGAAALPAEIISEVNTAVLRAQTEDEEEPCCYGG